eukprot:COSAG06_NODE_51_length_28373_cov_30.746021_7_plen_126_part_00
MTLCFEQTCSPAVFARSAEALRPADPGTLLLLSPSSKRSIDRTQVPIQPFLPPPPAPTLVSALPGVQLRLPLLLPSSLPPRYCERSAGVARRGLGALHATAPGMAQRPAPSPERAYGWAGVKRPA